MDKNNEIFEIYSSKEVVSKLNDKYESEKKAMRYVESITKRNLIESINLIEKTNPYENGYTLRTEKTDYDYFIKKRKGLIDEEKVSKTFGAIKDDGEKENNSETSIQRHIMLAKDIYDDVLGKPIFFEFVPNKEDDRNKKSIDLITYKKEKNILNLIELKKCKYIREQNDHSYTSGKSRKDSSESTESFIRAAFEISTYYSFFIHAIKNEEVKKEIKRTFEEMSGETIDLDSVEIRKVILAPFSLFNFEHDEIEQLQKLYDCYTIELNYNDGYNDLRKFKINSQEKLFKIEEK